ncbi:glycerol-3-phosphate 1-O-acyltransferase [Motiliproteus coralliicola]|uniref:Glycerol-3-phosphate acyltransferase n=1 Tax=Motiliproteus coralliicola TaxID=2283196 RepID=A0A369WGY0_9GAMM|nr:glycerol-3-phosphate 1-O-acyltransferase PlsY [Motiliproteus coralliicola]RDE19876.1 glycerol-3-phosphate 1-O-acyltransferase [Motiliproteus coralliicola]
MAFELNLTIALLVIGAYLLGSISSAVLICRALGYEDPRTLGSGNPGATNVWRTSSKNAAVITFITDLLKGALPVWLALKLGLSSLEAALCGLAAMVGHMLPIFFRFRGGKGVATYLGACLSIDPLLALSQISLWLVTMLAFRRASVASITCALATPVICYWQLSELLPVLGLMSLLLIISHRNNIRRLVAGNEQRL